SSPTTAPVIEDSYVRLLGLLDARLREAPFVFGGRPSASDFGLYGQLTQLAGFDPTPRAIALERAPRVAASVDLVEDLGGLEASDGGWIARDAVPLSVRALFAEVGRVYAPFLLANSDALARGADTVQCEIDGRRWVQKPFSYQGKCLAWLREGYAALAAGGRLAVGSGLAGGGRAALFPVSAPSSCRSPSWPRMRTRAAAHRSPPWWPPMPVPRWAIARTSCSTARPARCSRRSRPRCA